MIKALLLLSQLDNDDLNWMVKVGKKRNIEPKEILIHEGERINALYIVLGGTFSAFLKSIDQEFARIYRGEVIGEISYVVPRPTIATVQAIEPSVVLEIPRLKLNNQLQKNMGFAARFYKAISMCLADRMHFTVIRLGKKVDLEEVELSQENIDQTMVQDITIAKAKFNWLIANAS